MDNLNLYVHAPLIEECRKGNSKAQFMLYEHYSKAMYNLAYRILNNREDAEDILQEAFVECFRNLDSFRFESTFGGWIKKITVNKCINHIKKKKIDLTLFDTLPATIYEEAEEDEVRFETEKIFKSIEMLPDGYRIILTLYLLEGYDHSEISQILGISESTSKSQYSRAKEKLRSILLKN
ncbi:MAG: sigma-70 family RNA polymerase sigma factor [Bacteroidales bacterium]